MKKNRVIKCLFIIIIGCLFLGGCSTNNEINSSENYGGQNNSDVNFDETKVFKTKVREEITFSEQKVNIYLFWGDGCSHCRELAMFFDGIDDKYKAYFDLYAFEVWNSKENAEFMEEFASYTGKKVGGVPFMIIGEKVFNGYSKDDNKKILEAIEEESKKEVKFDYYAENNGK